MRTFKLLFAALFLTSVTLACDSGSSSQKRGTLDFRITLSNAENGTALASREAADSESLHELDILDIRHLIHSIEITTDEIVEGADPDDIRWITLYESVVEMLHTERAVTLQIPAGEYKGFRMTQRNLLYWVVDFEGEYIDLPSLNDSERGNNEKIVNHFGADSLYEIDEETGLFIQNPNDELLGTFEVKPNLTTYLIMQLNLVSLHWHDTEPYGEWNDGDEVDEIRTADGVLTMTDFIVTYE